MADLTPNSTQDQNSMTNALNNSDVADLLAVLVGLTTQISLLSDLVRSLANVDASNRQIVSVGNAVPLAAGAAAIGTVSLTAGAAAIGTVSLTAGAAEVGKVTQTYADSQIAGQIAYNTQRSNFSFLD
jgi:hypothetical protein